MQKKVTEDTADMEGRGKLKFKDVAIAYSDKTARITLPNGMSLEEGRIWLKRQQMADEETVGINETIMAYPLDGALAFALALGEKYGFVAQVPTPGFWGDQPPQMVSVAVGVDEFVNVPWGNVVIPGIDGVLTTSATLSDGQPVFAITGNVKRKHVEEVAEIAALARRIVRERSIYKGKAIRVSFSDDPFQPKDAPKFFDTSGVKDDAIVFPRATEDMINTNLFVPIENTDACRQASIPLKRGVLLSGKPGVGKTLTAAVTAVKCVRNGWTFIYLDDVKKLEKAMRLAAMYAPALVFAEDADKAFEGQRTDEMNRILNVLDGVEFKRVEIMVVVTTNFIDKIDKAALRMGRFDAVIGLEAPDAEAAGRLIRKYAGTNLDPSEDIGEACCILAGQNPSSLAEAVSRAKLAAIGRTGSATTPISGSDLVVTANTMLDHLRLMTPPTADARTPIEKAADTLAIGFQNRLDEVKRLAGATARAHV